MPISQRTTIRMRFWIGLIVWHAAASGVCWGSETGLWQRFEAQFINKSWQGNPFDLELAVRFTSPSGRTIDHLGFYAGGGHWKVYFMPDELGEWTFRTRSPDGDLDQQSGSFVCVDSVLEPPLRAAGRYWKLGPDKGDFPVIWNPPVPDGAHWGFRARDLYDPTVQEALRFADEEVGARLLGFSALLIASVDWAQSWPQEALPFVVGKEGTEFFLPFWDQLNAKLDAARARDMGAYIMLYSDDAMTPDHFGLTPYSTAEIRFMRYVVARLAAYPHILWDSGIDIGEYRSREWIDWYADWFLEHDPWRHPVGSRSGGGMPQNGTYFSTGGASLPSRSELMAFYSGSEVPVAHTDHWRPFIGRGHWTHRKIRTATWRCGLTGAQALYIDYNQGKVQYDAVVREAGAIGVASEFFRRVLRSDPTRLESSDRLIVAGDNAILAAHPNREYLIYDRDGGSLRIDLSSAQGVFRADWHNPRTGDKISSGEPRGGMIHTFVSPTQDQDWVLHIVNRDQY